MELRNEEEKACYHNMEESLKHDFEPKKPHTKEDILDNSILIKLKNRQT